MGEELLPGFLKTTSEQNRSVKQDTKARRVAKFLVLIGSDKAAGILSRLPPDQVEAISKEIATVNVVGAEEKQAILEEFSSLLNSPYKEFGGSDFGGVSGGVSAARRILHAAFGPEKGEELLLKAAPEAKPSPFAFLEDFSGTQLAVLFQEESPAAAALVFSRLPPKLSADALSRITSEKKLEILKAIARQNPVAPEVLEQVAGALKEKAHKIGRTDETNFNGMDALAAILKSSASLGSEILTQLEEEDPELGQTLKEKIYTLSDLLDAEDLPIQKKLAIMNSRDIVLVLKARAGYKDTVLFREKILSNLSHGRREVILEEEEIIGAVSRREVEEGATAFLAWFMNGREDGSIVMMSDEDLVR
jgi:flagellar motor switch protein FliG